MRFRFERCKEKGKIIKIEDSSDFADKELKEACDDLKSAEKSISENNPKWAIVQSYYTMFHAFRALLFTKGYREKSHACLKHAIEALFVDEGVIDSDLLNDFDFAMKSREKADYSYSYNNELAEDLFDSATQLLSIVKTLVE
jgi:Uncharacterized conserved protein related to C-terminal domain of eukaryotic chaperone, SACSIN